MLWAAILGSVVFWTSCSVVKEERQECPCILSVELKALPAYPVALLVNGRAAGEARRDTTMQLWVEKGGQAMLTAVSGASPAEDFAVRVPFGEQAPPLYAYRARADCTGDQVRASVQMSKHFCTLTLRFKGIPEGNRPEGALTPFLATSGLFPSGSFPSGYSISAMVRGGVNGFSLDEGRPLEGPFSYRMDGSLSCRIPRQRPGDALWLDLVLQEGVVRSFPLGTYLEKAGYDWTAPDLADASIEADFAVHSIRFLTDDGSRVQELQIVI